MTKKTMGAAAVVATTTICSATCFPLPRVRHERVRRATPCIAALSILTTWRSPYVHQNTRDPARDTLRESRAGYQISNVSLHTQIWEARTRQTPATC